MMKPYRVCRKRVRQLGYGRIDRHHGGTRPPWRAAIAHHFTKRCLLRFTLKVAEVQRKNDPWPWRFFKARPRDQHKGSWVNMRMLATYRQELRDMEH